MVSAVPTGLGLAAPTCLGEAVRRRKLLGEGGSIVRRIRLEQATFEAAEGANPICRLAVGLDAAEKSEHRRPGEPCGYAARTFAIHWDKPFRHFPAALGTFGWRNHKMMLRPPAGHPICLMRVHAIHGLESCSSFPICPATFGGWKALTRKNANFRRPPLNLTSRQTRQICEKTGCRVRRACRGAAG